MPSPTEPADYAQLWLDYVKDYDRLKKIEAAAHAVVERVDGAGFAADSTMRALREALEGES